MKRPCQFSLSTLILVSCGGALLLSGGVPMVAALVVSSRLLDNGVDPGDIAVIRRWDSWAFSLQTFALVALGMALIAVQLFLFMRRPRPGPQREPGTTKASRQE
jgi:hypothetical protein